MSPDLKFNESIEGQEKLSPYNNLSSEYTTNTISYNSRIKSPMLLPNQKKNPLSPRDTIGEEDAPGTF